MRAVQIACQIGRPRALTDRPKRGRNRTRRDLTSPAIRLTIRWPRPIASDWRIN